MKRYLLLIPFGFFLIISLPAQTTSWIDMGSHVPSTVSNANLTDVAAVGESVWISCSNLKGVFCSTDGGESFIFKDLGVGIQGLYRFSDGLRGWCVGGAYGFHTEDGGESWNPVFIGSTLLSLTFANDLVGYATGMGSVYRTDDGGVTWMKKSDIANLYNKDVMDAAFPDPADPMAGYVCVANEISTLFRTTDGGDTWNAVTLSGVTSSVNDLEFSNPSTGWAVGGESNIFRFENNSWISGSAPYSVNLNAVTIASGTDHCWAVGNAGTIFHYTSVAGWIREAEGLSDEYLAGVDAVNSSTVFAVGMNKTFLKYGPTNGIGSCSSGEPEIWPNPTSGHVCVKVPGSGKVSIEVCSLSGDLLLSSVQGTYSGEKQVLDLTLLPAGLYCLQVSALDKIYHKILIKR